MALFSNFMMMRNAIKKSMKHHEIHKDGIFKSKIKKSKKLNNLKLIKISHILLIKLQNPKMMNL